MSLISPGRSVVSVAIRDVGLTSVVKGYGAACENYHKDRLRSSRGFSPRFGFAGFGRPNPQPHIVSMAGGLRDLKVWQEAVALAGETVRVMRQHVRRET